MSKSNFIWAQGHDANVREPIKELAEKGWQHRDIPKASNMNWIFKQISDEFAELRKDMEQKAEETRNLLAAHSSEIKKQQEAIANLKAEQNALNENHGRLKSYTQRGLGKAFRADDFNTGVAKTMCSQLRSLEQSIRHYHRGFPEFHWPLDDHIRPRENSSEE